MIIGKKDENILALLQHNARIPISEIAKKVGLSENGVRYRIDKLQKENYITDYEVILNPESFGKNILAIFNIMLEPKKVKTGIEKICGIKQFTTIYQTTGKYTLLARGLFNDENELSDFINNELLLKYPIREYNVEIVLDTVKEDQFHP